MKFIEQNRQAVQQHDPDRYLLSLFAPAKVRPALWTLFAFNYEVAKTREVVSDTTIGLIRLQWWRDAIKEIFEGQAVRKHEVVTPLAQIIEDYNLPRELFDKLIYAREFDLEDVVPANLEGLLNYCDYTTTPLMQLVLKIIGKVTGHIDNDTVVVDISKQYALIGTLRAVPYMANSRRMMLPQDILSKHNVSIQKLFDYSEKGAVPDVVNEVVEGQNQLRHAPSVDKSVDGMSRFLRKTNHMSRLYEAQIRSVDYDVFDARMALPPKFMALRLLLAL